MLLWGWVLFKNNLKMQERWKRWEFNEITVQSSPHKSDSAEQLFSTKRQEMLNSEHYWFSSHFLHTDFSFSTFRNTRNHYFSIDYYYYYYFTYIFDIFFPLVPPGHSNEKPVVPWLEAIPALPFQPASAQREWELWAQQGISRSSENTQRWIWKVFKPLSKAQTW